jgi:hypothetical protein
MLHPNLVSGEHLVPILQQVLDLRTDLRHPPRDALLVTTLVERIRKLERHTANFINKRNDESDSYSTPNRVDTRSSNAGTSQNATGIPDSDGFAAKASLPHSFCARVNFAAFSFPA